MTCEAVNCNNFIELKFYNANASGFPHDIGLCTTELEVEHPETKTCNSTVDMMNNGTLLLCGVVRTPHNKYSKVLEILVQGQLYINLFNIIIFC